MGHTRNHHPVVADRLDSAAVAPLHSAGPQNNPGWRLHIGSVLDHILDLVVAMNIEAAASLHTVAGVDRRIGELHDRGRSDRKPNQFLGKAAFHGGGDGERLYI